MDYPFDKSGPNSATIFFGVSNDLRRKAVNLIQTCGTGGHVVTTAHHGDVSQVAHNLAIPRNSSQDALDLTASAVGGGLS